MNPNVTKYAGQVGFDAGRYTWFDLLNFPIDERREELNAYSFEIGWGTKEKTFEDFLMPSDHCAIIGTKDAMSHEYVVTYDKQFTMGKYTGPAICAWTRSDSMPMAIICDWIDPKTNSHLHVREDFLESFKGEREKLFNYLLNHVLHKQCVILMLLNHKASVDRSQLTAYRGIDNKPFINKKRRAKDKPPVYDWVTVELAPSAPRREHQGGTHASPARHERRGHFRKYPSGKITWVKPMWVGSIERGLIVKDYVPETA